MVVKINAIEVAEGRGPELEARFAKRAAEVDGMPGFRGFELLRPVKGEDRYFVVTHWETEEDFQNWIKSAAFTRGHAQARADAKGTVAHGSAVLEFEVVDLSSPAG
jgi:heme-degrading monooxygenase HmoA